MNTKNITPLEDFNWDEFENGGSDLNKKAEREAYEGTLNSVNNNDVVDGTVTAAKLLLTSATRATVLLHAANFATTTTSKLVTKLRFTSRTRKTRKVSSCSHTRRHVRAVLGTA